MNTFAFILTVIKETGNRKVVLSWHNRVVNFINEFRAELNMTGLIGSNMSTND